MGMIIQESRVCGNFRTSGDEFCRTFTQDRHTQTHKHSIWLACTQTGGGRISQNNLSRERLVPSPVAASDRMFGWIKLLDEPACSHLILTLKCKTFSFQAGSFQPEGLWIKGSRMNMSCSLLCSQDTGSSLPSPTPAPCVLFSGSLLISVGSENLYQWALHWCFSPDVKFVLSVCVCVHLVVFDSLQTPGL